MNIKTNDTVLVLTGKDKGKKGKVMSADPQAGKVMVEGVNVASRHQKARTQTEESGIIKKETPIYVSKVQLVCPKCGKGTRVGHKFVDGKKVRVCKKCGATI
ncbi:MAG: 50S ribosomal protein L24 [bacterium]